MLGTGCEAVEGALLPAVRIGSEVEGGNPLGSVEVGGAGYVDAPGYVAAPVGTVGGEKE